MLVSGEEAARHLRLCDTIRFDVRSDAPMTAGLTAAGGVGVILVQDMLTFKRFTTGADGGVIEDVCGGLAAVTDRTFEEEGFGFVGGGFHLNRGTVLFHFLCMLLLATMTPMIIRPITDVQIWMFSIDMLNEEKISPLT